MGIEPDHDLGDRTSREAFVQASYAELFHWFCRLTGSPDRSADLTQETFASFWGALDRLPPGTRPKAWLYATGRNLWRKQARDHKAFEPVLLAVLSCADPSAEKTAQDREFQTAAELAATASRTCGDASELGITPAGAAGPTGSRDESTLPTTSPRTAASRTVPRPACSRRRGSRKGARKAKCLWLM